MRSADSYRRFKVRNSAQGNKMLIGQLDSPNQRNRERKIAPALFYRKRRINDSCHVGNPTEPLMLYERHLGRPPDEYYVHMLCADLKCWGVDEPSLVTLAQPTQQALKLSDNPLLTPSMRGPAHRKPAVDADLLQLESRGVKHRGYTSQVRAVTGRHQQAMQMGFLLYSMI
jgi:hypothetical protein